MVNAGCRARRTQKSFLLYVIVRPTKENIGRAAEIIKNGGIVAFPTETVYGLGADAFNAEAVKKIFAVKGRPVDNPLIVHIAEVGDLIKVALRPSSGQDAFIEKIIEAFWPGPLTLVFKKRDEIPSVVSAGLQTVAVRMPAHKVALRLIKAAGVPIAAPSANISGKPSSTTAHDVYVDFGDTIPLVLDGGRTKVGVESTVLDLTVDPPVILRQGGVTFEELREIIPNVLRSGGLGVGSGKAPGMRHKHYAPRAPLVLALAARMVQDIQRFIVENQDERVGVLATLENADSYKGARVVVIGSRNNLAECARNLFASLRKFDKLKVDIIISEVFSREGLGSAIMERLEKAASAF